MGRIKIRPGLLREGEDIVRSVDEWGCICYKTLTSKLKGYHMKSKPVKNPDAPPGETPDAALDEVLKIIRLMGDCGLAEIDLQTSNLKLSLRKFSHRPAVPVGAETQEQSRPSIPVQSIVKPELLTTSKKTDKNGVTPPAKVFHKVLSPMAGTFYRAPSATSAPYVNEGDMVTAGLPICIVEAMKLMNEIKADKSGKVVKIHVDNAKPVEKGALLFEIDSEVTGWV